MQYEWTKQEINRIVWLDNFMTSYRLADVDVDVSEVLKLILEKEVMKMWTGWNWLEMWPNRIVSVQ
jgi:hypothetical protein